MIEKLVRDQEFYPLLLPCKCKKKCSENITQNTKGEHQQTFLEIRLQLPINKLRNPKRPRKNTSGVYDRNFTR